MRSFFLSPPIEFPFAFNAAAAREAPVGTPRILGMDIPLSPFPFPLGMRWTPVVCTVGAVAAPAPGTLQPPAPMPASPPRKSCRPLRAVMLVRALIAPGLASNWARGASAAGVGVMV